MPDSNKIATREEIMLVGDMLKTLQKFMKDNSITSKSETGQLMNKLEVELQNVAIKHLFERSS